MTKYEETGQYIIEVYPEKNRFHLYFYDPKTPADIPHYLEHITKACDELKSGFKLYVEPRSGMKLRFQINSIISESQKITVEKGISRAAMYLPKENLIPRLIANATRLFTKQPMTVFSDKEEAFNWLDTV